MVLYFLLASLKTNFVAHQFLTFLVYLYLRCQSENFQILMFVLAQMLIPQPDVFLRQVLSPDIFMFIYYLVFN
jgi:hypothetical protein